MADIHRLKLETVIVKAPPQFQPLIYDLFRTVDESGAYTIEIAAGATDQSLVLTGTGGITEVQTLIVIVDRSASIRPGGTGTTAFTLSGTPDAPAGCVFWRTSLTGTPVITNSDSANVMLATVITGGT